MNEFETAVVNEPSVFEFSFLFSLLINFHYLFLKTRLKFVR